MKLNCLCFLVVAMSCVAATAAFKLEPIPASIATSMTAMHCVITEKDNSFLKEPEYNGKPQYGLCYMQSEKLRFVAWSSTGGATDTIIIDFNKNDDVTDDVQITTSKAATVSVGGKPVKLLLGKPDATQPNILTLRPAEWFRGRVTLGDREYEAALYDMRMDGLDTKGQDFLLIDANGDGAFAFDMQSYEMEGATPLSERVVLNGDTWKLVFDGVTPNVTLSRYEGDCGRLETSLALGLPSVSCSIMGYVVKEGTPYILSSDKGPLAARIPVGEYSPSFFAVTVKKDDKRTAQLQYLGQNPIVVEKGRTRSVSLNNPGRMTVEAKAEGGKLKVSHKIEAGEALNLVSVITWDEDGKPGRLSPPQVTIRSVNTGAIMNEGSMEYG